MHIEIYSLLEGKPMILVEYNLLAIFAAAVMATLGWRFGMILIDQLDHLSHKFWSFLRRSHEVEI